MYKNSKYLFGFNGVSILISKFKQTDVYKRSEWDKVIISFCLLIFIILVFSWKVELLVKGLYGWVDGRRDEFDECLIVFLISIPSAIALWGVKSMALPKSIFPKCLYICTILLTACLFKIDGRTYPSIFALRSILMIWLIDIGVEKIISWLSFIWRNIRRT